MFKLVFLYLCSGVVIFSAVAFAHMCIAEYRGYKAFEYWDLAIPEIESKLTLKQLAWSMCIWPVRMIQFTLMIEVFYDIYEQLEKNGILGREEA